MAYSVRDPSDRRTPFHVFRSVRTCRNAERVMLLSLSGDQWLTLAGVASGVVGVIGGFVFATVNGRAERAHAERLARSERLHEQRQEAYLKIAEYLERQRFYLVRTEVTFTDREPPAPLGDDEWASISALAAISPSKEVQDTLAESQREAIHFDLAVINVQTAKGMAAGNELTEARGHLDGVRQDALDAIDETERLMQEELDA